MSLKNLLVSILLLQASTIACAEPASFLIGKWKDQHQEKEASCHDLDLSQDMHPLMCDARKDVTNQLNSEFVEFTATQMVSTHLGLPTQPTNYKILSSTTKRIVIEMTDDRGKTATMSFTRKGKRLCFKERGEQQCLIKIDEQQDKKRRITFQ